MMLHALYYGILVFKATARDKISKIFLPYNIAFEFRNIIVSWKFQSSIKLNSILKAL